MKKSFDFVFLLTLLGLHCSLAFTPKGKARDFLISLDVLKFKDAKSLEITKEASVVVDQFFAYLMSHIKYHAAQKADNVSNISSSHGSSISALPGYQITGPSKEGWKPLVAKWLCKTAAKNAALQKGIKKAAMQKACSYHSGKLQASNSPGQTRGPLLGSGTNSDFAILRAYSLTAGDAVKAQVIDFTDQDLDWLPGMVTWSSAQYRPIPASSSWTYPIKSRSTATGAPLTIGLFGDWGTGGAQAIALMQSAVNMLSPDHISHLGDVYYYGIPDEAQSNIYRPLEAILPNGTPFWNIPGNHDYYSGGQAFYSTIDLMRSEGMTQQEGSYFALDAPGWRLIHLDTGYNSRKLSGLAVDDPPTYLPDEQAKWAVAQAKEAKAQGKRIAVFSHHQLFSMHENVGTVNNSQTAVNMIIYQQLNDIIPDIDIWFWGHEHSAQVFDSYMGLKRGRLLGASAVPALVSQNVYTPNPDAVLPAGVTSLPLTLPGSYVSGTASFTLPGFSGFLKRSFVLLSLTLTNLTADYYEADFDCWSQSNYFSSKRGTCEYQTPVKVWSETI